MAKGLEAKLYKEHLREIGIFSLEKTELIAIFKYLDGCYIENGTNLISGCCGFFGLFGRVLKVVLPNVLPVSVAGIFRGPHSVLHVRKNNLQNTAKEPEKLTTTIRSRP